jgi:hypothetical protein
LGLEERLLALKPWRRRYTRRVPESKRGQGEG